MAMKLPQLLSITCILSLFGLGSSNIYAYDGRILFTGTIVDASCVVMNDDQVLLESTQADRFKRIGDTSAVTPFSIRLTDCPEAVKNASVSFSGDPHPQNPELLNTFGVAQGVGIELVDGVNQQRLSLRNGQSASSMPVTLQTGGASTLTFGVRYVSTAVDVTSGTAAAYANFTVTYP